MGIGTIAALAYVIGAATWYGISEIRNNDGKEKVLCTYPGAEPCDRNCKQCGYALTKRVE